MKCWPTHKGCEKKLTADQVQSIKTFISQKLPDTGTGTFMRTVLFSPKNEINWYFTAHHFSHQNPQYSQDLFNIVYPD